VIHRDEINLCYDGSPDTALKLRASLLLQNRFDVIDNDEHNVMESQKAISKICDHLYGDIKEALCDILEEYQMAHSKHKAGRSKVQGMIEELIDRIPA